MDHIQTFIGLPLFIELTACVLFIGFDLFAMNETFMAANDFYLFLQVLFFAILSVFIYCFFGEGLTYDTLNILTIVHECPWYDMPTKQQRSLMLLIQRSQKIFRLKTFGGLECSRRLFFKVRNSRENCSLFTKEC